MRVTWHRRPDCWTSWTWTTTKQQSMLFVRTHLVARYMGLMFGFYQQRFGSLRTPLSHKNHLRGSFHRFQQQQYSRPLPLVSLMTMSTSASTQDLETYSIKGPIHFAVHLLKFEWVLTRIAIYHQTGSKWSSVSLISHWTIPNQTGKRSECSQDIWFPKIRPKRKKQKISYLSVSPAPSDVVWLFRWLDGSSGVFARFGHYSLPFFCLM